MSLTRNIILGPRILAMDVPTNGLLSGDNERPSPLRFPYLRSKYRVLKTHQRNSAPAPKYIGIDVSG